MENPIKMDDLGVPPFSETPISTGERQISSISSMDDLPNFFPIWAGPQLTMALLELKAPALGVE